MRVLQASATEAEAAIEKARALECDTVAWNLREPCGAAVEAARKAGLRSEGFLQVARDPEASEAHPEWRHCPQHHEWLTRFPDFTSGHPALVAPYIGLNTRTAFAYAVEQTRRLYLQHPEMSRLWLADIQGAPMGCGCGNPCCRSWDNAPGEKLAPTPYLHPETLFPLEFYRAIRAALLAENLSPEIVPVLCPECERSIQVGDVDDPDGPEGTDLCQGIPCVRPCALDYWPAVLAAFRAEVPTNGLLLMTDALGKNHPVFGAPRRWATLAHTHYGEELIPCIEPEDASAFESVLILTDAPQNCWPTAPPPGYTPEIPPIMCGYCPPQES